MGAAPSPGLGAPGLRKSGESRSQMTCILLHATHSTHEPEEMLPLSVASCYSKRQIKDRMVGDQPGECRFNSKCPLSEKCFRDIPSCPSPLFTFRNLRTSVILLKVTQMPRACRRFCFSDVSKSQRELLLFLLSLFANFHLGPLSCG